MPKIYQRAAARRDLVEHFIYLAENASLETAERFLAQTEISFNVLAEQPLVGAPLSLRDPALAGMRKWPVDGFENHLIFYLPHPDGISVVRILHAARDWWGLLGIKT